MFENIPIELENNIYKFYFSKYVLSKIVDKLPVYITMSNELVNVINKENFSADPKYFLSDGDKKLLEMYRNYMCMNCFNYGFMCGNCDEDRIGYKRLKNIYNREILTIFNQNKDINNIFEYWCRHKIVSIYFNKINPQ